MQGKIRDYGIPLLDVSQVTASGGDAAQVFEPGVIVAVRNGTQWSLATYVQMDNTTASQGEALVANFATLAQFRVKAAAVTDGGAPIKGIACATIGSLKFGWSYIWGYVEKADLSHTAASGEYLMISASTAGKLTPNVASVFNAATLGSTASAFVVVAVARTAIATGIGSISLIGMWG